MARTVVMLLLLSALCGGSAYAQTDEQVAARLTPIVHACEKSPENGGTLQQALCYKDEIARQDQMLNRTWLRVMGLSSPSRKAFLRRSERQWIKYRDEDCHKEASEYINSTASYMFNVCMADGTIRRTIWLEQAR